jgi:hypothetical protein
MLDALFWLTVLMRNLLALAMKPGVLPGLLSFMAFLFLLVTLQTFGRFHTALGRQERP